MKKTLNLYRNTTYGRTLRDVKLDTKAIKGGKRFKITNHKGIKERFDRLYGVDIVTPATSYIEVAPLPFPYTTYLHGQASFVADLRNHLKADTKLSEENNEWAIKSSSFDAVESTLTLLELLTIVNQDDTVGVIDNMLTGDVSLAYVTWLSGSINRAAGTNNDFPIVSRVRLSCALYFLALVNDVTSMDDDFLAYAKTQLMRKSGFNGDLVDLLKSQKVNKDFNGVLSLSTILRNLTDDPRFEKFTDMSILQLVASHLYINNTNNLIMLAVDNPYVFLTCLRFSFTREFRSRSNFKTLLETAGMERTLTDIAGSVERVVSGYLS